MTDNDAEFEKRLLEKVMKLTKKKRGHSTGGFCGNCMKNNHEGTEDRHGKWQVEAGGVARILSGQPR